MQPTTPSRPRRSATASLTTEDEDDILLDILKELNGILEEYEPTAEFDNDLFEQIVQDITVNDNTQITFRLLGDIQLTEKINEKGRCKSA